MALARKPSSYLLSDTITWSHFIRRLARWFFHLFKVDHLRIPPDSVQILDMPHCRVLGKLPEVQGYWDVTIAQVSITYHLVYQTLSSRPRNVKRIDQELGQLIAAYRCNICLFQQTYLCYYFFHGIFLICRIMLSAHEISGVN